MGTDESGTAIRRWCACYRSGELVGRENPLSLVTIAKIPSKARVIATYVETNPHGETGSNVFPTKGGGEYDGCVDCAVARAISYCTRARVSGRCCVCTNAIALVRNAPTKQIVIKTSAVRNPLLRFVGRA